MHAAVNLVGAACLVVLLAGCTKITAGDANTVSVDTGDVGNIAPGTREWLSWLQAKEHCEKYSKVPEIHDLKGSKAIYKCVAKK